MRPEMSLVFLTTLSGVGQGLFIFVTALFALSLTGVEVPQSLLITLTLISLIFPGMGAIASFFHLGHPSRGWKAIRKWKHSWLSREVIFLPMFAGLGGLFFLGMLINLSAPLLLIIASLASAASIGLYVSSAMLYAAIHFIKEWANAFTVVNFIMFGLTSGSAVGFGIMLFNPEASGLIGVTAYIMVGLGAISFLLKFLTFWYNDTLYNPWSLRNALGVNSPHIKIQDTGCAYHNYNTEEFHQPITSQEKATQKTVIMLIGFLLPLVAWVIVVFDVSASFAPILAMGAFIFMLAGLIIERKLFFVMGNHVQNLYYGNFRPASTINPLLVSGRK